MEGSQNPEVSKISPTTRGKIWWNELDGLRALAFFLVFYSHSVGLFFRQTPGKNGFMVFLSSLDQRLQQWGWIGVDLFFVMSAFLITSLLLNERAKYERISLKNFLTRRILRIWPLYFVYLALAFSFIQPLFLSEQSQLGLAFNPDQISKGNQFFLAFLFFLGNYAIIFQGELIAIINPLWSLCIEEQFYLLWGSIMAAFSKPRHLVILLCLALLGGVVFRAAMFNVFPHNYLAIYMNGPARMDSILLGCLAAFVWRTHGSWLEAHRPAQIGMLCGSAALLIYILACCPTIDKCDLSLIWVMTMIAVAWTLLLLSTLSLQPLRKFFSAPLLVHIGRLTYGMYIFHVSGIIISIMTCRLLFHMQSKIAYIGACWGLGLGVTYLMARLSWRFLESPCLRLKERFNQQGDIFTKELTAPTLASQTGDVV